MLTLSASRRRAWAPSAFSNAKDTPRFSNPCSTDTPLCTHTASQTLQSEEMLEGQMLHLRVAAFVESCLSCCERSMLIGNHKYGTSVQERLWSPRRCRAGSKCLVRYSRNMRRGIGFIHSSNRSNAASSQSIKSVASNIRPLSRACCFLSSTPATMSSSE